MEDVLTLLMLYTHRATACECFSVALRRGTFGVYSLRNMTFFIEPLEKKVCLSACGYVVVGGGMECTDGWPHCDFPQTESAPVVTTVVSLIA